MICPGSFRQCGWGAMARARLRALAHLARSLVQTHGGIAGTATVVDGAWVLGQTHRPIAMVVLGAATLCLPRGAHRALGQWGAG